MVFEVEASCYEAAVDKVREVEVPAHEGITSNYVETYFEHDEAGQRVMYLPNEDKEV